MIFFSIIEFVSFIKNSLLILLLSIRWKYRTKSDRTWSTLLYLVENKLTSKFRFKDSTWSDVDVHETRVRQRLNAEDRSRIVRSNVDQQFFYRTEISDCDWTCLRLHDLLHTHTACSVTSALLTSHRVFFVAV